MKVIKKVNNNCALCLDSKGRKVVAFGKGIGFQQPPYEIALENIQRIYYDIDEVYIKMIHDIPEDIIELSAKVIEYARTKIDIEHSNIVFTLADHIYFAMKRYQEDIQVHLPVIHDIQFLYDEEMEIGKKALKFINSHLESPLPDEEAIYIALHIINSENICKKQRDQKFNEQVIDEVVHLIETDLKIKMNKKGYHYSRFVTHLTYLLKRGKNHQQEVGNHELLESLAQSFPEIFKCTQNIQEYLSNHVQISLTEEECVYLMMHINRLCSRENYDTCD